MANAMKMLERDEPGKVIEDREAQKLPSVVRRQKLAPGRPTRESLDSQPNAMSCSLREAGERFCLAQEVSKVI